MAKNEKRKNNWRDKFRFAVFNDTTYEEIWRIRLTKYNALVFISGCLFVLILLIWCLIAYTRVREFIPNYPDVNMRRAIVMNAIMLDSLEHEIEARDKYFEDLNSVISGKQPVSKLTARDTAKSYSSVPVTRTKEQTRSENKIEKENKYSLDQSGNNSSRKEEKLSLTGIHFFPPVKGVISSNFDTRTRHFGIDLVTAPKAVVSSSLDGTVIMTGWTMETGFVIVIQHSNNLVSIYKHNSTILKEMGDRVNAGEAISIVGSSGELYTSGPHLHFELWYNGQPIDPSQYIFF
ncbi:MAG TPA: M23 family metallopeptidase [Bacteroidales bacterium]|nr:M23 family metallopeptidase [Bacteroidales bacterium]